jgi:hypothetical protein
MQQLHGFDELRNDERIIHRSAKMNTTILSQCFSSASNFCFRFLRLAKKSSQVKLLITNNAFCIVQRATSQSKTGNLRDYGVAEAPPGFQAGWSDCIYFYFYFLSLFCLFCLLIWSSSVSFCTHEGTLPYRSSAQMTRREEVGVSFVV